jgi:Zn-dependent protease
MPPGSTAAPMAGSFRLFRAGGITVSVHWSWLLVAAYELQARAEAYASQVWNVAEYLALFGIVLMHEFGHALACRSVGGRADHIVLWPLGGVAFVAPPPRPGAWLWSIAAGPLVNVVLLPVTVGAYYMGAVAGLSEHGALGFLRNVAAINLMLLLLNVLPVYPLDGGQILRSLLWFVVGPVQSLMVASVIALVAVEVWFVILSAVVGLQAWAGFRQARLAAAVRRRADAACPNCGARPPVGALWVCDQCRTRFDTFAEGAVCPTCRQEFPVTTCPDCHRAAPITAWLLPAAGSDGDGPAERR